MRVKTRQTKLIEIVRRREKVSVDDLAVKLGASRETIRRDLTQLSEIGKILKVHGGARIPRALGEGTFKQRQSENVDAKVDIAQLAASLFEPGQTLFVDTGSTTLFFIEAIAAASVEGLTLITNSTENARTYAMAKGTGQTFLLGGEFGAKNSQTVGTMAAAQIRSFRAHHAVLTIGALDARSGAMDYDINQAQIAKAMVEQSEAVTILADSSKLGALASFEVCPLTSIDRLITEKAPPHDIHQDLETAGIEVIFPDEKKN
ncbi:MAG TPA: DeoR/GlpR transcriptional regulator [Octadecabacter sp.]|nr:DeoR/GlpR transcriptional regulator [Octadecabacter sp.]